MNFEHVPFFKELPQDCFPDPDIGFPPLNTLCCYIHKFDSYFYTVHSYLSVKDKIIFGSRYPTTFAWYDCTDNFSRVNQWECPWTSNDLRQQNSRLLGLSVVIYFQANDYSHHELLEIFFLASNRLLRSCNRFWWTIKCNIKNFASTNSFLFFSNIK